MRTKSWRSRDDVSNTFKDLKIKNEESKEPKINSPTISLFNKRETTTDDIFINPKRVCLDTSKNSKNKLQNPFYKDAILSSQQTSKSNTNLETTNRLSCMQNDITCHIITDEEMKKKPWRGRDDKLSSSIKNETVDNEEMNDETKAYINSFVNVEWTIIPLTIARDVSRMEISSYSSTSAVNYKKFKKVIPLN